MYFVSLDELLIIFIVNRSHSDSISENHFVAVEHCTNGAYFVENRALVISASLSTCHTQNEYPEKVLSINLSFVLQ